MPRRAGQISPTTLRAAMSRRGVSADDIAAHLDISPNTVHSWLDGTRAPSAPLLVGLARALGLRPADLTLVSEDEERLHDLRLHAGLLQQEACEAAGLRQPQLSKMERGVSAPREELCNALAAAYGVPPARVFEAWNRTRNDRRRQSRAKFV